MQKCPLLLRRALQLASILLLAMALPLRARAEQAEPRSLELEAIRASVGELRAELAELDEVETGVDAELRRIDLELRLQRQMVAEATTERQLTEESLRTSLAKIETLEATVAAARERLTGRILALYKETPTDWLRGLVSVRAPADLFLYLRTLRYLVRRDARALPVYLEERAELAAERDRLEIRERDVLRLVERERLRLAELARAQRRQRLVAEALDRERKRLASAAENLDDKERKLALLIAVLADPDESTLTAAPILDFRGALDWPIEGEVSVPFGPRREFRYGTSIPHNGIQIIPSRGPEVAAVFPGVVIFAASFEGFGPTVVLHHRNKVFTLYAGLDELKVVKSDVVTLAQVLGNTSSPLYFAIRVENQPEDPLGWLR